MRSDNLLKLLITQKSAWHVDQNFPSARTRENEVTFKMEKIKFSWEKGKIFLLFLSVGSVLNNMKYLAWSKRCKSHTGHGTTAKPVKVSILMWRAVCFTLGNSNSNDCATVVCRGTLRICVLPIIQHVSKKNQEFPGSLPVHQAGDPWHRCSPCGL